MLQFLVTCIRNSFITGVIFWAAPTCPGVRLVYIIALLPMQLAIFAVAVSAMVGWPFSAALG